jgi:ParB-like chromosome segregation protein Spo0J
MKNFEVFQARMNELVAHPLNRKLYGDEDIEKEFVASVRANGIIEPITIASLPVDGDPRKGAARRTYVLSGHRRFLAAKNSG